MRTNLDMNGWKDNNIFFGKKGTIKDIFTVILGLEGRAIFNMFSTFSRTFLRIINIHCVRR